MSDYEALINNMAERINALEEELDEIYRRVHEAGFGSVQEIIRAYTRAASKLSAIRDIASE